jgi:hypothetical protein
MKTVSFWDVTPCGFVRTEASEERIASIVRMTRICELGATLTVISNQGTIPNKYFLRDIGSYKSYTA